MDSKRMIMPSDSFDSPRRRLGGIAALAATACLLAACQPVGFTVIKNVNALEAPSEALVIFDKTAGGERLRLEDLEGNAEMAFADDGAIVATITGNQPVRPTVFWSGIGPAGDSFDAGDYDYLLITCMMDGQIKRTFANGRVSSSRPGNLWFSICLYDAEGKRCGQENLASLTEDQTTPATLTTVKVPLMLVTGYPDSDASRVAGIGFSWGATHDYNDRTFRLVIDRIALAR